MARVFVTRELPFPALERLAQEHELDVWEQPLPPDADSLRERATQADALLTLVTDPVDAALLDACPDLKAIANMAVGTDNIDLDAAAERGIPVGNTPDVLAGAARIWPSRCCSPRPGGCRRAPPMRAGEWVTWEPDGGLGVDRAGATLGIVGQGRIGDAVARRAGRLRAGGRCTRAQLRRLAGGAARARGLRLPALPR